MKLRRKVRMAVRLPVSLDLIVETNLEDGEDSLEELLKDSEWIVVQVINGGDYTVSDVNEVIGNEDIEAVYLNQLARQAPNLGDDE